MNLEEAIYLSLQLCRHLLITQVRPNAGQIYTAYLVLYHGSYVIVMSLDRFDCFIELKNCIYVPRLVLRAWESRSGGEIFDSLDRHVRHMDVAAFYRHRHETEWMGHQKMRSAKLCKMQMRLGEEAKMAVLNLETELVSDPDLALYLSRHI